MVCVLAARGSPRALGADDAALAARVKAAFVFNFIRFTEWPAEAFASPKDPLIVGVVGSGTMLKEMDDAMHGKSLNERPIVVQEFAADHVGKCHVLFIAAADGSAAATLSKAVSGATLTIGDWEGFTGAGGIVRFFEEDGKERFEINVGAAGKAHLQISGKLMKLARTVNN
jgi:hypothetical protein